MRFPAILPFTYILSAEESPRARLPETERLPAAVVVPEPIIAKLVVVAPSNVALEAKRLVVVAFVAVSSAIYEFVVVELPATRFCI